MKTMKRIETIRVSLKLGVMAPLVMTGLTIAPHAWADTIPLAQQSTMVFGSGSASDWRMVAISCSDRRFG